MKKFLLLLAILVCGALFVSGCGGDDDDDGAPASGSSTNGTSGGTSSGGTSGGTSTNGTSGGGTSGGGTSTPAPDANATFQALTPSGLALVDKFSIAGRGTVYVLGCNEIPGAVAYVFTCFGTTENVGTPQASFLRAGPEDPFGWDVYAINSAGYNTQTASAFTSP